ncbi:2-hydroxyacyl-CoA lyase 2 isoform X2 [Carcharodon carcharias]|uniref:2-hydroxyacyl-CoA lyase 2 isoform X2 n=1 Tax=Carcharodon carcharias TaxID=13397 RepID=UPI001B7F3792|nr:2-hydroxyacyl-CoA lyase 2 isoform X2 [Carcharodon carcharias]
MEPVGCVLSWGLMAIAFASTLFAAWKLRLIQRILYRVEASSPRHGGESVAEVLKAHGVKYVFTLVGGHISPILVACEKIGIRVVDTRHEVTAVFAADAVARLSGPVFVEFPIDVLYPYHIVQKEVIPKSAPKGVMGKVINWYLHNHLYNLFAGAWDKRDIAPLPVDLPMATADEVQCCVEIVSRAKKPVILLGSQATLPPTPVDNVRAALESLAIPCFLGGMARGLLGRDSPIHIRQNRRDALKEADLVILAGTVCDFRLSYGRVLSRRSQIIAVNRNRSQLLKNSDMFWKPTLAVRGDPGSFLVQLAEGLKGYQAPSDWTRCLKEGDVKKEKTNSEKAEEEVAKHLNPLKVLHHVEHLLEEDSIIVTDGGDFVGSAAYILKPRGPLRWLDPGAFGTLGVGGGFALGAKLCRPESQVWIVYGDGSLGYSIAEFDTFKRHKTPVIALVGNDAGWSQISREQVPLLGSNVACGLAYTDYHTVAEGYGGKGFLLNRENEDQMDDLIRAAQEECRNGNPTLINVLIGKSNFREGSISV